MFGATAARFVETPLFVVNSKYDTWQEKVRVSLSFQCGGQLEGGRQARRPFQPALPWQAILGLNQTITRLPPKEQAFWVEYGREMVAQLRALPPQHGAFLSNCPAHCQTGIANWYHISWLPTGPRSGTPS